MSTLLIVLCVILWGVSTFLNRLSVDQTSPVMMQVIAGFVFVLFIPFVFLTSGVNPLNYKWNFQSVALTATATVISIIANICLYISLKGSNHTGSSAMMISLYPAVTFLLSVVFLSEQLSVMKVLGLIAMVGGAILLNWK